MRHLEGVDREVGVILVLTAFLFVALVGITALVLDIAAVRQDRRTMQTAADLAAVAGANSLDYVSSGNPQAACTEAWIYLQKNLPDLSAAAQFDCSRFSATVSATCSDLGPVVETIPPYQISMQTPVPPDSPLMANGSEGIQPSDGTECERFAVVIHRSRSFLFGPVLGVRGSGVTSRAVARYSTNNGQDIAALTALNPTACNAVSAGAGYIEAFSATDPLTGAVSPGVIFADSDGSSRTPPYKCTNSHPVYQANGGNGSSSDCSTSVSQLPTSNGIICALPLDPASTSPGRISTFATQNVEVAGSDIYPTPTHLSARITRAPVDAIYHCNNLPTPPVGCVDPIANLSTKYGSVNSTNYSSAGLSYWNQCSITRNQTIPANTYVDCPILTIKGATLTVASGGTVVFGGSISVQSNTSPGSVLQVSPGTSDTTLFLQNSGELSIASSSVLNLPHTFVYSGPSSGGNNGCIAFGSGSNVTWTAVSSASVFSKLMLWDEGTCSNGLYSTISGSSPFNLDGVLFAPNSTFKIGGGGTVKAVNVQLWVSTLYVDSSNSGIYLQPDPENAIPSVGKVYLIR